MYFCKGRNRPASTHSLLAWHSVQPLFESTLQFSRSLIKVQQQVKLKHDNVADFSLFPSVFPSLFLFFAISTSLSFSLSPLVSFPQSFLSPSPKPPHRKSCRSSPFANSEGLCRELNTHYQSTATSTLVSPFKVNGLVKLVAKVSPGAEWNDVLIRFQTLLCLK